mgnify:CR=1 FL=1
MSETKELSPEAIIETVREKLKEEHFTSATIRDYTNKNITTLASLVDNARESGIEDELKQICDEHLSHDKDSIIASYISGMLALASGSLDTSPLEWLVDTFLNHRKMQVVEGICEAILRQDEKNTFALRTLVTCYNEGGSDKQDALIDVYKKLVSADSSDASSAKVLATYYEKKSAEKRTAAEAESDETKKNALLSESADATESAIGYYKKAIYSYIPQRNYSEVSDIWNKLVSLIPEKIDVFYALQRKIAKAYSAEKSSTLLMTLYNHYKENARGNEQKNIAPKKELWDTAIEILKKCLSIDSQDSWARRELADCYSNKYKNHGRIDEYIRESGISQSYRNIFDAISDFEKHIAFDEKNYVYHKTWGVGIIAKIMESDADKPETLRIHFGKKYGLRDISLKMAVECLQPLDKNHIWVLKALFNRDTLSEIVKSDKSIPVEKLPKKKDGSVVDAMTGLLKTDGQEEADSGIVWMLKTVIKSFSNSCDIKKIKAELVPSILSPSEWTTWNTKAKRILENNSEFSVNPNGSNEWMVREKDEITQEEKLSNEFKSQKQFFPRVDILMKFVASGSDTETEQFLDMKNYFASYIKSYTNAYEDMHITEQLMASYLIIRKIDPYFLKLNSEQISFEKLYRKLEKQHEENKALLGPREMYASLKDTKNTTLKDDFLLAVGQLKDWTEQYILLFPVVLKREMVKTFLDNGETEKLQSLAKNAFDDWRNFRDTVYFLFDECRKDEWFTEIGIPLQKQLIALVNIVSQAFKAIDNHVNATENKKIISNITKLIFEPLKGESESIYEGFMRTKFEENDRDTVLHMFTLVDDIQKLDASIARKLRRKILEWYPGYQFHLAEEKTTQVHGMLVTKAKLDEKRLLEEKMRTTDTQEIAKEVGEAKEKGDLKENAEYIEAKKAQQKLAHDLKRLQEEIARAVLFDPTTATNAFVSFGTVVTLSVKGSDKEEVYTILGPWESAPERGIISYMSPFGTNLLDKKVGDDVDFKVNEYEYHFKVKEIAIAKF